MQLRLERATVIVMACLLLGTTGALAASSEGQFAIKEAGAQTCEIFVAERTKRSNVYYSFRGWAAGYVSSYNKLTPDTTDVMSWQTSDLIDLLINNYCSKNPQARYIVAIDTLLQALHSTRLRGVSEVVEIKTDKQTLQLYKDVLRRVQQALTERGLYSGPIDGAYGPGTSTAISAFQAEAKLEQSGYPDQLTLLRLFQ